MTLDLEAYGPDNPFALQQRNQVFRNRGGERFEDVTGRAGAAFALSEVSRGAAFGDVDNDGDTDVLIANGAGPVRLLVNEVGQLRHWIGLRLVGRETPRDMLGARVEVTHAGRVDALAPRPRRRELRVGQRPARHRRSGGTGGLAQRAGHLAERRRRGMGRPAERIGTRP